MEARMNNLFFLYEENGFTVSKLTVLGTSYFIIYHKATDRRYIRKGLSAVNEIVRNGAV